MTQADITDKVLKGGKLAIDRLLEKKRIDNSYVLVCDIRNKDYDKIGLGLRDSLYTWLEKTKGLQIPLKKQQDRKNDYLYRATY